MNSFVTKGRAVLIGLVLLITLLAVSFTFAGPSRPLDAPLIQQRMQRLINYLDSPTYAAQVSWPEHIVLVYQLAQGRPPTPVEFYLLTYFTDHLQMSRSQALSAALRGEEVHPSWDQLRAFLARTGTDDFRANASVRQTARELAAVSPEQLAQMVADQVPVDELEQFAELPQLVGDPPQANLTYNIYYGFLHAHSHLSDDASGGEHEAYIHARDEAGLDFFGLTDHAEFLVPWPWNNEWEALKDAAQAYYEPGVYATLWGFEWSNPILGHVNVINSNDYTSSITDFELASLYGWLANRPQAFGRFNHPGGYDFFNNEFYHLDRYRNAVPQMVGMEMWNGNTSFDTYYYDGGYESNYSYLDEANRKGWVIGPVGGQDNHEGEWGTLNDFRVGVLAESLTRQALLNAYRNRRFFSTEDKDLALDVRADGFPMGSRLVGVPPVFDVTACDDSGDTFQEVRLYRNGDLLHTQAVSGNCIDVTLSDPAPLPLAYYYVIVRQDDDNDGNGRNDEAIASPIWIKSGN